MPGEPGWGLVAGEDMPSLTAGAPGWGLGADELCWGLVAGQGTPTLTASEAGPCRRASCRWEPKQAEAARRQRAG